jgi:dihydrofolate reductase
MKVAIIAAVALNSVIGNAGDIPWRIPQDWVLFRNLTRGNTVIMGRRTWESLQGAPFRDRKNVVVSREDVDHPDVLTVRSLSEAIARTDLPGTLFVAGGAALYAEALPLANELHITRVHLSPKGDTFFPDDPLDDFRPMETWQLEDPEDAYTTPRATYTRYQRHASRTLRQYPELAERIQHRTLRPLSEMPSTHPVVVLSGSKLDIAYPGRTPENGVQWTKYYGDNADKPVQLAPTTEAWCIARTKELDRAVQSEIARAFGELIEGVVRAHQHDHPEFEYTRRKFRRDGIATCKRILHTSMGGPIPDEVPQ